MTLLSACDHLGMFSNNADRLVRFYGRLGFKEEKQEILSLSVMANIFGVRGEHRLVKLVLRTDQPAARSPSLTIEIFEPLHRRAGRRENGRTGYNHWGFRVGDRERFLRRLQQKGVPVIEVRRDSHSVYFIRDPDGNRIEIRR